MDEFFTPMILTAKRNMLKFLCGSDIFCKVCGNILDCKRAVEIGYEVNGKPGASRVMCCKCYDVRKADGSLDAALAEIRTKVPNVVFEINDGRELFGRKRRAAVKPAPVTESAQLSLEVK